jgi:hypothetical protein
VDCGRGNEDEGLLKMAIASDTDDWDIVKEMPLGHAPQYNSGKM